MCGVNSLRSGRGHWELGAGRTGDRRSDNWEIGTWGGREDRPNTRLRLRQLHYCTQIQIQIQIDVASDERLLQGTGLRVIVKT